jgi:hypothetical protein
MAARKISILPLFGLIASGVMTLVIFGAWLAGPAAYIGWPLWLGRSLVILLAAIAAAAEKRARNGILDFQSALRIAFGVIVMAIVAQTVFYWLIPTVIDPHFYQRLVPVILEKTQRDYRAIGFPEDQIRSVLDDIRTHNQFSFGRMIQGTGPLLLLFGIIAILIAVTVRSKVGPPPKPETQNT